MFEDIRILKYSGVLAGLDGDLYVNYAFDTVSNCYIAIIPALNITLQLDTVEDIAVVALESIEALLKSCEKNDNLDAFAMFKGIEIRDIPNIKMTRRTYRMPQIILAEFDSVDDLENQIKGK